MKITKFGHSALYIEHKGVGFMIDPGGFSDLPEKYPQIDALLLTHEHPDHLQVPEVKKIKEQFPDATVITNHSIADILKKEGIDAQVVGDGDTAMTKDVTVTGVGSKHAEIFCDFGRVPNTGYMIDDTFFYPGDNFTKPPTAPHILAAPVSAPWMAVKEVIAYVNDMKPAHTIPVHDAVLSDGGREVHFRVTTENTKSATTFHELRAGESIEL